MVYNRSIKEVTGDPTMKKLRLLAWALVCSILFQSVMPVLSLTAAAETAGADSELTFNGGYPYGKDMTKDSVTLVAPVQGSGAVQWYQSTARDGEYTAISGAKGKEYKPDFSDKSSYPDGPKNEGTNVTTTFMAYENGTLPADQCPKNWYRCTVDGKWSKPIQLLQAIQLSCNRSACMGVTGNGTTHIHPIGNELEKLYQIAAIRVKNTNGVDSLGPNNTWWYISNGNAAYTVYPKPAAASNDGTYQAFDVIGRYKHRSATQNYYYYWLGESNTSMSFDTNNYTDLRLRFDDNDEFNKRVLVDVDLPESQDKIAMVFNPRLGEWKMYKDYTMQFSGIINAIFKKLSFWPYTTPSMQDLTGIQMVGSTSLSSNIFLDTPAWNITFDGGTKPTSFWLGHEKSQMYTESEYIGEGGLLKHDPSKYAHSFNTIPSGSNFSKATEEANAISGAGTVVRSVQCKYAENGLPEVYPLATIAWSGKAGQTVTFGVAAGNIIDTKAVVSTTGKCKIEIGGDPVIWMNKAIDDANTGNGYTYDGAEIELQKEKTTVETLEEQKFTTADVKRLLDVVGDLDYTFYEAEGTRTKDPNTLSIGAKLNHIPIDSRDYFLVVSVPEDNPYFTGKTEFYLTIFAKPIPVYNVVPIGKVYDGTTKVLDWNWHDVKWGDDNIEKNKVYDRDNKEGWGIVEIEAEYETADVGNNKKIVGLLDKNGNRKDINIRLSGADVNPNGCWNYVPYLAPEPTGNITLVPVDMELAPPEAETTTATSITLKTYPNGGTGTVQYAMKTPTPGLPDTESAVERDTPPTDDWQDSPVFTGLTRGTEYYFYLKVTNHPGFDASEVTSKGAAIPTSSDKIQVNIATVLGGKEYDGTPVTPQVRFVSNSPTCPSDAIELTWFKGMTRLDGPPVDAGDYTVEVSITPEYADDYAATGNTKPWVLVYKKDINVDAGLFTAEDRDYDGTTNVTLHYNRDDLKAAIKSKMLDRDKGQEFIAEAGGQFIETYYPQKIEPTQAGENKRVEVTIVMAGEGANNYSVTVRDNLAATAHKAARTISAPEIANEGEGTVALAVPDITGVDGTAGTDGIIFYAMASTNTPPVADSEWNDLPTFTGIPSDGQPCYFFARIINGKNYLDAVSEGTQYPSGPPHSHNWDSSKWSTTAAAHWHECLTEGCPVKDNTKKDGYGPHDFTEWENDPNNGGRFRVCKTCSYKDTVHTPLSRISMGTWVWSKQYHANGGELFFNMAAPTVQISAVDTGKDLVSLKYVCLDAPSDPVQFTNSEWKELMEGGQQGTYSKNADIPELLRSGVYVYAMAEDAAGGVWYSSTPKLVFDTEAPKIQIGGTDVTSGCTYCNPQTVAVSDNLGLASVTLDGTDVTASAGTIRLEEGRHTIVATDKAGNCSTVTVQVNDGHTNKTWSIGASCEGIGITITTCTVCGHTSTTSTPGTGHTWDIEFTVDQEPTCTETGIKSLHCTKCGAAKGFKEIPAAGHKLEADWHMGASHHWKVCSICGKRFDETSHQGSGRWISRGGLPVGIGVIEYMECKICGAVIAQRYRLHSDDPNDPRYGSVEKQTTVKPGAPEAKWENSLDEAMEAAGLDEEDLTDQSSNSAVSHKLVLSVSPFEDEKIPGKDEIEKTAETELGGADAEFLYMDVSLTQYTYVEKDQEVSENTKPITSTEKPIEIMLQIPEELQTPPEGIERTFYLLYAHKNDDGTTESAVMEATNSGNGELHFYTDRFSTYAIAYVDTPIGEKPPIVPPPTPNPPPSRPSTPSWPSIPTPTPSPEPVPSPDPAVDHIDYIHGYQGQFRPEEYMSRAEAAQIFYSLLTDEPHAGIDFDDVPRTAWYREPVSVLAGLEIVKGIGNNLFAPKKPITRAEFAAMAVRFMGLAIPDELSCFPDVSAGAWYSGSVAACEAAGWIKGYPDGSFHPTDYITRAQVVTIVNHMLKRAADEQALEKHTMPFSDVPRTHWAYEDILEAAIRHKAVNWPNDSEVWE